MNDNYSIEGSIPSPPLYVLFKEDSFVDTRTHVRSRLKNASSSIISDYCYAIFVHELMCSIAENNCDMHQHRTGVNSPNTATGCLDLRRKDYSNFLHSIDSRNMVKILCASQEYFHWDVLITFNCSLKNNLVKTNS